jgi:prepilin peptidase CpaA
MMIYGAQKWHALESHMLEFWVLLILPAAAAFAAAMDIFTMTIPNRVSMVMALAFFPAAWIAGIDWWQIADHVGTGAFVLVFGFLLFARGLFGGGDAKLLAAIALWLGYDNLLPYLLCVAVTGGFLAMGIGMWRQVPLPRQLLGEPWAHRLHKEGSGIPYGVALASGVLMIYPNTSWFASLVN